MIQRADYRPWGNTSIIGVAGSSGSGKTSLSLAVLQQLNLPWVVLISTDSFYRPLTPAQSAAAFRNEFDFDAPDAIDFDLLVEKLRDLKAGKKADIPVYSFSRHAREKGQATTVYSAHVILVEGIYALRDERILALLDLKIFTEADLDICLGRRLLRDVRERGRDIEGVLKQWEKFVKPAFHAYVEPQRRSADIIVPRGIDNVVAISMVSDRIHKILDLKSKEHQLELRRLGKVAQDAPLSPNVVILPQTNQVRGIISILMQNESREDFVFYFDRLVVMMIEKAAELRVSYEPCTVLTPVRGLSYNGLRVQGETSAVAVLRGGSALETGLRRVIPDCRVGRMLIQTNYATGEPALHFLKFAPDVAQHARVLLLDAQMKSGGAALMAVRALLDHGVSEQSIVFVTYSAGRIGLNRLMSVFPEIKVLCCRVIDDTESRWVEERYFGV